MITYADLAVWSDQLASGTGVQVVVTITYDQTNEVCANVAVARKRRSTTLNFDQTLLISILSDPVV